MRYKSRISALTYHGRMEINIDALLAFSSKIPIELGCKVGGCSKHQVLDFETQGIHASYMFLHKFPALSAGLSVVMLQETVVPCRLGFRACATRL
jgi:hypothetical protein